MLIFRISARRATKAPRDGGECFAPLTEHAECLESLAEVAGSSKYCLKVYFLGGLPEKPFSHNIRVPGTMHFDICFYISCLLPETRQHDRIFN